jgi:hypothetical protein
MKTLTIVIVGVVLLCVLGAAMSGGRQDVGEHDHLVVGDPIGDLMGGVVGERNPHIFGLSAVDERPENLAAATPALPVTAVAAIPRAGS